jgi:ribulose-5-phosphate 4-epimerase/fuculose-1-phosphate aldolase
MDALRQGRDRLYAAGLIGVYPDGIGYGNISGRSPEGFMVSGTQTGHLATTTADQYCTVTDWDIAANRLRCVGPLKASSESLTHAALYDYDPAIGAIAHGHHPALWHTYREVLPTTRADVPYGTPAMAAEMIRLFTDADLATHQVLIMAGHQDGVLAFGATVADAVQRLLDLHHTLQNQLQKSLQTPAIPKGQGYG